MENTTLVTNNSYSLD